MRHFLKRCEEFTLCGGVGDADGLFTHSYPDNYAIYHIITKGSVKMARPFESEYVSLDADGNNFVDVKDYLYSKRYYTSSTPYHMYGFNALEPEEGIYYIFPGYLDHAVTRNMSDEKRISLSLNFKKVEIAPPISV